MMIGELRETIEIQKYTSIVNDNGGTEYEYETLHKCRAKVKYVTTKEYMSNSSDTVSYILKFIIRKRQVSNDDFVLYKNERYNIKHVFPFEDRRYMELTAERVI